MRDRSAAHRLLDRVRSGDRMPHESAITKALIATGDIRPSDFQPLQLVRQPGTWEKNYAGQVKPAGWLDGLISYVVGA